MEIDKIPPMKPVLVEHVSDDINVLQQNDVTKQKTVVTARALEDIFKCAPIVSTNPTDEGYFVSGKVDLDKIVTACSRTLAADQYVNGPTLIFDNIVDASAPQWAVNHQTKTLVPHAFIYTYSVLDNNTLSWANYSNDISIDDAYDTENPNYRAVDARAKSPKIRQIYVPNVPNEYYNITNRSRQDLGDAWTRYGYLKDDGTYQWEAWFKVGKTHNGAEYFTQIVLADGASVETPMYDVVYHIYGTVPSFRLPNANLDGYRPGMKVVVEVHPPASTSTTSSCRVVYDETDNVGNTIQEGLNIYITPKTRRNTKDIFGNVRDDVQTTSVAVFEIIETTENGKTFRTWELDGGVEESDFIAGLAQMLGEHTDLATGDLVQYNNEAIKTEKVIDLLHPITTCGYVMARFLKHQEIASDNWKAYVEILNPASEADFTHIVPASGELPQSSLIYYTRVGTTMSLADGTGHPTKFNDDEDYYTLSETCARTSVIRYVPEGSATIRTDIGLSDLTLNEWKGFNAFANRNCVLHIKIVSAVEGSSQSIATFRDSVKPLVYFFPDPHDSYIQKGSINPSAYTWMQLEALFNNGGIINLNKKFPDEYDNTIANCPASSRAVIEAYVYLASKLQNKGLFLGNRAELNVGLTGFDEFVSPGYYYTIPKYAWSEESTYPPNITSAGCNLMVVSNGHAPAGSVHEEEGGIVDPTKVMQIAILMGTPMEIYTRIGTKQTDNTWTWTAWREFLDWEDIHSKPLYFHARWDYFENPDKVLNRVDSTAAVVEHNTESLHCEVKTSITEAEITAAMEPSTDPEWDTNVNYDVPQFMVGINTLSSDAWESQKLATETGIDYVVNVTLPAATASELTTESKTRRRKIRFLFYGNPSTDWTQVLFRLSFASSVEGQEAYTYERNWGGSNTSIIVLEFEQMDLPTGERVWCPHEIG